eukprot:1187426-Amphidinium_carterae.1
MSHRGRLNVLHNLMGKPMGSICAEMREDIGGCASPYEAHHATMFLILPRRGDSPPLEQQETCINSFWSFMISVSSTWAMSSITRVLQAGQPQ